MPNPKFPRKFRAKLEKMAEKRDQRQAEAKLKTLAEEDNPFETLWHAFILKNSVHLVHAKFDHDRMRIRSTFYLNPKRKHWRAWADPPWRAQETPTSEAP